MRVLFCSPIPTENPRLGASRVIVDLAEAWRAHGWDCDVYSAQGENVAYSDYPSHLSAYLSARATEYDVIDFPYSCKPWIDDRHKGVLTVARSVLLLEHCHFANDPVGQPSMRDRMSKLLRFRQHKSRQKAVRQGLLDRKCNMSHADLVTVGNSKDKACLTKLGIPADKVIVVPYGLNETHRRRLLTCIPSPQVDDPTIAFLGTFDYRKGCLDFAAIYDRVSTNYPGLRLKLLGTRGMCADASAVYRFFPKRIHDHITIVPSFDPENLPDLLDDCSAGLFPSYREGFGIGVIEMLASGLPVAAYDAPGPCDILPKQWLAPRGNCRALADRLIVLLNDPNRERLTKHARTLAAKYTWSDIAAQTKGYYMESFDAIR